MTREGVCNVGDVSVFDGRSSWIDDETRRKGDSI